jgi:pimeloyl-ACP methyl ester carboxylesterase
MWFLHVSLLHGWLPPTIAVAAWGAVVVGVAWWRRAIWHWLVVAAAAGAVSIVVSWALDVPARVGSTYPRSFLVWAALPLFALGAALWQWPRVGWRRRTVALASVPLLAASAGLVMNAYYSYLPTVGDLLGAPLPGQVNARQLVSGPFGTPVAFQSGRTRTTSKVGTVASVDIPAPVSHFPHHKAYIWVPPVYFSTPRPHLPVLMLIAGTPGSPGDWLRGGGALALANAWAAGHNGYAPMMVLPDANGSLLGDTECVDGPRGNAETYLTVDVVTFMRQALGAAMDPQQWAIAGLSEGGTCALDLATRHPARFATFADFSGDAAPTLGSSARTVSALYGGSWRALRAHDPTTWFASATSAGVEGFFAVGNADHGHLRTEERIAQIANRDGMRTRVDIIPGGRHSFRTWAQALRDAYPWIVSRLSMRDPLSNVNLVHAHSARAHNLLADKTLHRHPGNP